MIDLARLPLKRPAKMRTGTIVWNTVSANADLVLGGTMLCVDPSIGSASSMPGYAIYVGGALVDSGRIKLPVGGSHIRRLYELSRSLREDFAEYNYDVLVVEEIPMVRHEKFGRSLQAQVPLHRAVGAVLGALPIEVALEIPPITWRSYIDLTQYEKTDETDAVMLGWAAIEIATQSREPKPPRKNARKE